MIKINFDKLKINNINDFDSNLNSNIINNFKKLVDYIKQLNKLEQNPKIKQINNFRIKNLNYAISVLTDINYKITLDNVSQIYNITGIGKGTVNRIIEVLKNNSLDELNDLEKQIKLYNKSINIVDELNNIIGIGDKKAFELIKKYNIKSIDDLINKVNIGKIIVNDKIKLGIKYYGKYQINIPRNEITDMYLLFDHHIPQLDPNFLFFFCGSYRRLKPFCNDVDILLFHPDIFFQDDVNDSHYLNNVVNYLKSINFLVDDLTESDKTKYMGFCKLSKDSLVRRIDIRMIGLESYACALAYFTGSYQLNRIMRSKAKQLNYKLNEYGLYDLKTNNKIMISNEEQLFEKLNMKYLKPELRDFN